MSKSYEHFVLCTEQLTELHLIFKQSSNSTFSMHCIVLRIADVHSHCTASLACVVVLSKSNVHLHRIFLMTSRYFLRQQHLSLFELLCICIESKHLHTGQLVVAAVTAHFAKAHSLSLEIIISHRDLKTWIKVAPSKYV